MDVDKLRRTVLGQHLYDRCVSGQGIDDNLLARRLKKLQSEGHFKDCEVKHIVGLCGLREGAPPRDQCIESLEEEQEYIDDEFNTCAICASILRDGEGTIPLDPCGHYIHAECMKEFTQKYLLDTCPFCRGRIRNPELQKDLLLPTLEERQRISLEKTRSSRLQMHPIVNPEEEQRREREALGRAKVSHLRGLREILQGQGTPFEKIMAFLERAKQVYRYGFTDFKINMLAMQHPDMMRIYGDVARRLTPDQQETREYMEQNIDTIEYILSIIMEMGDNADPEDEIQHLLDRLEEDEWILTHLPEHVQDHHRDAVEDILERVEDEDLRRDFHSRLARYLNLTRKVELHPFRDSLALPQEERDRIRAEQERLYEREERRIMESRLGMTEASQLMERYMTIPSDEIDQETLQEAFDEYRSFWKLGDVFTGLRLGQYLEENENPLQDEFYEEINDGIREERQLLDDLSTDEVRLLIKIICIRAGEHIGFSENHENLVDTIRYNLPEDPPYAEHILQGINDAMLYFASKGLGSALMITLRAHYGPMEENVAYVQDLIETYFEGQEARNLYRELMDYASLDVDVE